MKSYFRTLDKLSNDSRNPCKYLDAACFERLIGKIDELGAPVSLSAPDNILCLDLDDLQDLNIEARRTWLQKAKNESLQRYLQAYVDEIRDAAENGEDVDLLLGAFISDDFAGRDRTSQPPEQATLTLPFYEKMLSSKDVALWTKAALTAAKVV